MRPHLRMTRAVVSAAFAAGLFATAACSASDEPHSAASGEKQQITDILGRNVEVPKKVERILMGGQRMLYTTAILNKEDPLHGVVAWPDDLQQNDPGTYKKYQQRFSKIGDIKQTGEVYDGSMSVEQALESRPDVFIVSANSFEAAQDAGIVDGLEKAGIPTVTVDYFTDPVKNTAPSVRLLGKVLGHEKEAEEYAQFYESKVDMVHDRLEKAKANPTPTFLWRAPGYFDCCSTFAKSNLAQLVTAAGGKNLGDDMIEGKQGQVSPEALAGKDPDVIIATGADWTDAKQQPKRLALSPSVTTSPPIRQPGIFSASLTGNLSSRKCELSRIREPTPRGITSTTLRTTTWPSSGSPRPCTPTCLPTLTRRLT